MNSYERKRRICKMIVLVLGILSINNIILTIRNYSYAYFEKNVKTGVKLKITTLDEMPVKGGPAIDIVKATLGQTGGVIGVTTSNTELKTESSSIREYHYSGLDVNNYIYFNCSDGTTYEKASSNCEKWRIIGIFKDEEGVEHLKIVRNEYLIREIFPATYTVNQVIYNIQSLSGDKAYWNYPTSGTKNNDNNWATAGLQYWLNAGNNKETKSASDGYMSYLSKNAKSMIEETKYYLGTFDYYGSNGDDGDNAKTAYAHEREISNCVNNIGNNQTETGCRVWKGNEATWTGKIALMYPSDYGFSESSSDWNIVLYRYNNSADNTSWFYKNMSDTYEWLLSPSDDFSDCVAALIYDGNLGRFSSSSPYYVRPCLYLISETKITNGDGSSTTPYFATIE